MTDMEPHELAETLSSLARSLQYEASPDETLMAIATAAVQTVPGAEHACITMVRDRRELYSVAGTSDVVREIDRRQYECREGPCLDALWEEAVVRMDDDEAERRWPTFTREIRGLGVRAMCCFQLFTQRNTLGALNLYAAAPGSFDAESEDVGKLLASHASVALADAQKIEQLEQAISTRDTIGQAKGILMERYRVDSDAAFRLLVGASQRSHLKLHEVAARVAETGMNPADVSKTAS
jgi:transcriptional regulator with GAF, ATPase, and Fis domain